MVRPTVSRSGRSSLVISPRRIAVAQANSIRSIIGISRQGAGASSAHSACSSASVGRRSRSTGFAIWPLCPSTRPRRRQLEQRLDGAHARGHTAMTERGPDVAQILHDGRRPGALRLAVGGEPDEPLRGELRSSFRPPSIVPMAASAAGLDRAEPFASGA